MKFYRLEVVEAEAGVDFDKDLKDKAFSGNFVGVLDVCSICRFLAGVS